MQNATQSQPASHASQTLTEQAPSYQSSSYQAPRVQDLGAWQAVTLIYTIPINPRGNSIPNGGNNGY